MNRIARFVLSAVLALGTVFAASTHAPQIAHAAPHAACCGAITPNGYRLADLIDSMHVEDRWLPHRHILWETGEADEPEGYKGHDTATHCSSFAAAVGKRLGVYMLRPPDHPQTFLASAQTEWFHTPEASGAGWRALTGNNRQQEAQTLANQGYLVTIAYESPDSLRPGHIVIVRPSEKSAEELAVEGPQIAQAGTLNHTSSIAAKSFTSHPGAWPDGVKYYAHTVDWQQSPHNLDQPQAVKPPSLCKTHQPRINTGEFSPRKW